MNLLETITEQISAQSLPLFAVTVAAVPCPDTPVILTLHWHGFIEEKIIELEDAEPVAFTPIPSLALQVNHRWSDLTTLDRAAMEAGWELGAWDVARAERAGCAR
ncbi:MAG TPA: diguanylate cyclase, partial [Burkholderiales bacterium]